VKHSDQPIRLGILGTRRGLAYAEAASVLPNVRLEALCGRNPQRLEFVGGLYPGVKLFTSYDEMLDDKEIDAVVVAHYADEHAPAACQALKAGKHVLSEVLAFGTIAEGVELARVAESAGKVYMLDENLCYLPCVQEMRRLYEAGELGELVYAEGEYVHFARDVLHQLVDLDIPHHWRLWLPPTYYVTHSLGPILRITGLRPVAVQAATGLLGMNREGELPIEAPSMIVVRLENGALVKSLHGGPYPREPWQPWYLIGGSKGCIENNRWPDPNEVTVYLDVERTARRYMTRHPQFQEEAAKTQHWGSDLISLYQFVKAIQTGSKPDIDIGLGLDMTLCGNLAWRSILQGGGWVEVPDLRREEVRKQWENDRYSSKPGTPEPYLLPNNSASRATMLPAPAVIESIRRRQADEPYYKAMYRD
jgi:predicted dehydrogenase